MLRERHPQIACRSVTDFRSAKGIAAWIAAQA
jgi:[acyl-carrier-protein] S-malonyltransferase